ncbi:nitroreductase [Ancylobacter sp. 6x-1]|uniref:Putative NAD(P)H nitroreductase n=1 Tax=Ancylobacter crimeensis TaxID=2579147 RepID=A0ABT0D8E2_9HYPH|nr:nitroreductase [Ancylobacter crimeensis]MCK0196231.1 nitroreductase [Ancylobacter crimeensis]
MSSAVPDIQNRAARSAQLALLEGRRSVSFMELAAPGPDEDELARMLTIASRVPDHAALVPWRFIVIGGQNRADAGRHLGAAYRTGNDAMEPTRREKFAGIMERLFLHAPLVVVVVSRPDRSTRIPVFEQELSAGAVCLNLLHAAYALGYAGNWVTGWAATHPQARRVIGVEEGEQIAGFVHLGTPQHAVADRPRPEIGAIVQAWHAPEAG